MDFFVLLFFFVFIASLTLFLVLLFDFSSVDVAYSIGRAVNVFSLTSYFDALLLFAAFLSFVFSFAITYMLLYLKRGRKHHD
jgi:hypothetical protein